MNDLRTEVSSPIFKKSPKIDAFALLSKKYGDLIYHLCECYFDDPAHIQSTFRSILRALKRRSTQSFFERYERAWVLSIACELILKRSEPIHTYLTPNEQLALDASPQADVRLDRFKNYFTRLPAEDRLILLLSEKFKIPHDEISVAIGKPLPSLKLKIDQAMRSLEEWIWGTLDIKKAAAQEGLISQKIQTIENEKKQDGGANTTRRKIRWSQIPWYIRATVEALAITGAVLSIVLTVPKVRTIYEKTIEKKFESVDMQELAAPAQPATTTPDAVADSVAEPEEDESFEVISNRELKVGETEIWRFIVNTDSPQEIREKIIKTLTQLGVPRETEGLSGVVAPGGIQFNIVVDKTVILPFKKGLEDLVAQNTASHQQAGKEPFTWYKSKLRAKIPPGKTRLVIWLSQI